MTPSRTVAALLLVASLFAVPAARANQGAAVCVATGDQAAPLHVSDGAGGVIVVWYSSGAYHAQHLGPTGAALWPAVVDFGYPYRGTSFAVTSDCSGGVLVCTSNGGVNGGGLAMHRIDAAGSWRWGAQLDNGLSWGSPEDVTIASDGGGGAYACWSRGVHVWGHVGAAGGASTVNGTSVVATTYTQGNVVLVPDGHGGAYAFFQEVRGSNGWDIYGQHLGGGWGPDGIAVAASPDHQTLPLAASDGAGGAVILWKDAADARFHAQRLSPSGAPIWTSGSVVVAESGFNTCAGLVGDSLGGAYALLSTTHGSTNSLSVQKIDANGQTPWGFGAPVPLAVATSSQSPGGLVWAGSGPIAVWAQGGGGYADTYAQMVDSTGAIQWGPKGLAVCTATGDQSGVVAAADGAGGALLAWSDARRMGVFGWDIYSQRVGSSGEKLFEDADVVPLDHVMDVPGDQGGRVFLQWRRCPLDRQDTRLITSYRVWRRNTGTQPATQGDATTAIGVGGAFGAPAVRMLRDAATGVITYWEALATLPAERLEGYSYTAATTSDSTVAGPPYTAFFVSALTTDPFTFFDSQVDSAYSVDNLSPPTPTPFVAQYGPGQAALHWLPNPAPDFRDFRLYRGSSSTFVPGPTNLLFASRDTGYVDRSSAGGYYKLAAMDIHGNASRYAMVSPTTPTATLASLVSADWTGSAASLSWYGDGLQGLPVNLYRREDGGDWGLSAQLNADGEGYLRYADTAVLPGHNYSYRLGILDGTAEQFAGETSITIPTNHLAIRAVSPNPVRGDAITFAVALASTDPVAVRVLDLAGRVVREQTVRTGLSGSMSVSLGGGTLLRPGVYLLELRQGSERAVSRFIYLR